MSSSNGTISNFELIIVRTTLITELTYMWVLVKSTIFTIPLNSFILFIHIFFFIYNFFFKLYFFFFCFTNNLSPFFHKFRIQLINELLILLLILHELRVSLL